MRWPGSRPGGSSARSSSRFDMSLTDRAVAALVVAALLAGAEVLVWRAGVRRPVRPDDRIDALVVRVAGPQDGFAVGAAGWQALLLLLISTVPFAAPDGSLQPVVGGVLAVALVLHRRAPALSLTIAWGGALLQMGLQLAPGPADLAWGALAGVGGVIGLAALYRGLALGPMGTVAATSAVLAAALPVVVSVLVGGQLGTGQRVGIGLALLGVTLLSRDQAQGRGGLGRAQRAPSRSTAAHAAPADTAATDSTAGHAPIFLASGWEAPKPPRYSAVRPPATAGPRLASHVRPA